jgi:hypothetical protein
MTELIRFDLDGGGVVLVESDEDEPGIERASRLDDFVIQAGASLEQTLEHARSVADAAFAKLRGLTREPDELEVEFGIRLTATAGAVVAKAATEGHLRVRLLWSKPDEHRQAAV